MAARFKLDSHLGFTLIELLVVISIMTLAGTFALVNLGSFRKDQELQSAVVDVQNFLRLAQTNASTNLKCNSVAGVPWDIEFKDSQHVNLICADQITTLPMRSTILIDTVTGAINCQFPVKVEFAPVFGTVSFIQNPGDSCINVGTQSLMVTIKNDSGNKVITITKGGSINVQ
ncbi:MAG: type II secretion system protein [Candidatus Daviesbacteria bacterium]|nr:type II secretion system protein [Candidatus Daviesbacteria bacterium]